MPLDQSQLCAIGRITVAISELELEMTVFAWALISPDLDIGRTTLAGEQFNRVLEKIRKLNEYVFRGDPELLGRVKKWADSAGDVQRRRSDVLHSQWVLDQPTGRMVGMLMPRKEMREVDASAEQLNRLADDIISVRRELMSIIRDMPDFPPQPWFPKQSS
jgi:hypothetical protein